MKKFKKAMPAEAVSSMLMSKSLGLARIDYIPVPVKDDAHRNQIIEQVNRSFEELEGKGFFESESPDQAEELLMQRMGVSEDEIAKKVKEGLKAVLDGRRDQNTIQEAVKNGELTEATFKSLAGEAMKSLLDQARDQIISAAARSPDAGIRGLVRLGFEDGMGVAVVFTNDKVFYDNIEDAELPGFDLDDKCGDLSCKACHPNAEPDSPIIH